MSSGYDRSARRGMTYKKRTVIDTRTTKGKTWEEIYGVEYANKKREQIRQLGKRSNSEVTRQRISESKKAAFANGAIPSFTGRKHTEATKKLISTTRRERYGTRASLNKQVRYTAKYRQWRTEIFERDDYACQQCGNSSAIARRRVILNAHHIVELWSLLTGLTFDEAMNDEKVWDKGNAVTLCLPCHKAIPISDYWSENDS